MEPFSNHGTLNNFKKALGTPLATTVFSPNRAFGQVLFNPSVLLHLQSWKLINRHMRNVAEKCFSANLPKVLIFLLLLRTGTINDFSY